MSVHNSSNSTALITNTLNQNPQVRHEAHQQMEMGVKGVLDKAMPLLALVVAGATEQPWLGTIVAFVGKKLTSPLSKLLTNESILNKTDPRYMLRAYLEGNSDGAQKVMTVVDEISAKTHLNADTIVSMMTLQIPDKAKLEVWKGINTVLNHASVNNFVGKLGEDMSADGVEKLIKNTVADLGDKLGNVSSSHVEPEPEEAPKPGF